ncbi:MAG: alpha/beta hydrolase [Ilumatobacteraceae bacterium]
MTTSPAPNPHLDMAVVHHGPPIERARLVGIAVHGRGQTPQYMLDHLIDRLHHDDTRDDGHHDDGHHDDGHHNDGHHRHDIHWVLPAASGGAWYPLGFMAPMHDNQPHLDHALAVLDHIVESMGIVQPERIIWAGFSQGACLVSEWVARHPRRWAGLLAFTGGRIGPEGTDLSVHGTSGRFDGMPAYFGAGARDAWVPLDRVERTAAAFRSAGADVTVDAFDDDLHEIRPAEIARARALIYRALPKG